MSIMRVYQDRMPAGVPGHVSRPAESTLETCLVGDAAIAYGAPVKRDATGKLVTIAAGDTEIYGFLARPYPTGGGGNDPDGKAARGSIQSVMRRGYMTVTCAKGTPAKGGAVHVRLADGGVETAADGGATLAVPAVFMGGADADGNVEIAFNL